MSLAHLSNSGTGLVKASRSPAAAAPTSPSAAAAAASSSSAAPVKKGSYPAPLTVAFLLFPGFEQLDVFGPAEAFGAATFLPSRSSPQDPPQKAFNVIFVGVRSRPSDPTPMPVQAAAGVVVAACPLLITPTHGLADANLPRIDILVVPGGVAVYMQAVSSNPSTPAPPALLNATANYPGLPYVQFIQSLASSSPSTLLTSVCTGAAFLAKAGLLTGRRATTNSNAFTSITPFGPLTSWLRGVRFVDDGRVVTATGVSGGIDMALHVILRLCGKEVAMATANDLEYRWDPSDEDKGVVCTQ